MCKNLILAIKATMKISADNNIILHIFLKQLSKTKEMISNLMNSIENMNDTTQHIQQETYRMKLTNQQDKKVIINELEDMKNKINNSSEQNLYRLNII
jgi:vacuolar-type H+-ATPase catalytic subunit A/Vma1